MWREASLAVVAGECVVQDRSEPLCDTSTAACRVLVGPAAAAAHPANGIMCNCGARKPTSRNN